MIRANHAGFAGTATLHFKNAVYQGGFDSSSLALSKSGLAYFHQHRHLLACQAFDNNQLNGHAFFIYNSQHYQFGEWRGNTPHGVTLLRMQDIVVIASYEHGVIAKGSTIIAVLWSDNIGVAMELSAGDHWRVRERSQVYCLQQVQKLLRKCQLHRQASLSLLKYINQHLNTKDSSMKLRYANGIYRFGFQAGMSVEFDEQERITAINIDDCEVEHKQASPVKAGQVYRNYAKSTIQARLKNQSLADPSRKYFDYFQELLSGTMRKTVVSGFIKDNSSYLQKSRQLLKYSREISLNKTQQPVVNNEDKQAKTGHFEQKGADPILIVEPLEQFSRKKEQYLNNFLKSHENSEDSLEKAKIKRFRENIEGPFAQSKYLRQPVNAFSIMQKQLGIDKPPTQPEIKQTNNQTPIKHKESESQAFQSTTSKKTKTKIFDKSPNRRILYEFSPPTDKSKLSAKSRKKIFADKPKQQQSQARPATTTFQAVVQQQQSGSSIANDETPSSPIQALQSYKEQSGASAEKHRERTIAYSPSGPVVKLPNQSNIQRKRTLTEYQSRSSSIVSEGMSDFQMRINSTMQANSPPKKMKKQNDIYRDSQGRQAQRQPHNGRVHGNIPYLQHSLKRANNNELQVPPSGQTYYRL